MNQSELVKVEAEIDYLTICVSESSCRINSNWTSTSLTSYIDIDAPKRFLGNWYYGCFSCPFVMNSRSKDEFWGNRTLAIHRNRITTSTEIDFKVNKKTLCVLTIALICSNLASFWKFQYFLRPLYNPVRHLWWSFHCKNSKPLSIFTKTSIIDACLGSKHASAFWRLFKRFISLKYFTL